MADDQAYSKEERKDFFISYTGQDRKWAEWIAWHLEKAGYSTVLQAWDFHAGGNFVVEMDMAMKQAERTIAVLSPDYFASQFTAAEWTAAFRRDPTGERGRLLPIRVRPCEVEGLFGQITSIDLIDRSEQEARTILLAEVQRQRHKPLHAPTFPSIPKPDRFPGTTKHRIPRRLVVIGLVGLVTVVGGSGLSWLALSRRLSLPSFQHEAKWVPTGNMLVGRLSLRATTLMNGMVLIEGGLTSGGLHTAESELFNPRTGIWGGTKGRLNETRDEHTATLLLNGNVLVSGGFAGGNITRDSAELYNPRTDRWTMTKKMGRPRTRHTATRLQDGKVLIVGGVSLNGVYINTAELYDPVADTWSSAGALTIPRADHVAVRLLDDRVLVTGGTLLNDGQTKTSRTEVYDPSTNGWALAQDMNVPRAYFTAVLLSTGNVLAIGGRAEGFDSTATTELYNPVRGSWSMTGDINSSRENVPGQEAVILSDGSVLVVGGDVEGTSETYSPATGKWTGQIKMGSVRSNSATALLEGGQVLVVGGFDCFCPNPGNTHILASAEIYTPS